MQDTLRNSKYAVILRNHPPTFKLIHKEVWVWPILMIASFSSTFIKNYWIEFMVSLPISMAFVLIIFISNVHSTSICPVCIETTPLDGNLEAAKKNYFLKIFHMNRIFLYIFIVYFISDLIISDHKSLLYIGCTALATLALMLMCKITIVHNILQPWCPYCHWDEGGDEEEVPNNIPTNKIEA